MLVSVYVMICMLGCGKIDVELMFWWEVGEGWLELLRSCLRVDGGD